jgi:hypothetical protein
VIKSLELASKVPVDLERGGWEECAAVRITSSELFYGVAGFVYLFSDVLYARDILIYVLGLGNKLRNMLSVTRGCRFLPLGRRTGPPGFYTKKQRCDGRKKEIYLSCEPM